MPNSSWFKTNCYDLSLKVLQYFLVSFPERPHIFKFDVTSPHFTTDVTLSPRVHLFVGWLICQEDFTRTTECIPAILPWRMYLLPE